MPIPPECPGSKSLKQPVPSDVTCPCCGKEFEVWSDEIIPQCPFCKAELSKSGLDNSCIKWCEMAEKCIGTEKYNELMGEEKGENKH